MVQSSSVVEWFGNRMVAWITNNFCSVTQKFWFANRMMVKPFEYRTFYHLNTKQVKVCYSDKFAIQKSLLFRKVSYSDPHCYFCKPMNIIVYSNQPGFAKNNKYERWKMWVRQISPAARLEFLVNMGIFILCIHQSTKFEANLWFRELNYAASVGYWI